MKKISQALISVSDKRNLKKILSVLKKFKVKIISSGGTFKEIKKNGIKHLSHLFIFFLDLIFNPTYQVTRADRIVSVFA